LKSGDIFLVDRLQITSLGRNHICCIAIASLVANIGRLKIQQSPIYVTCPDPGVGLGGNVLFELYVNERNEDNQD
jgi:hypothetical protein